MLRTTLLLIASDCFELGRAMMNIGGLGYRILLQSLTYSLLLKHVVLVWKAGS
jgi:hypothetical protein